MKAAAEPSSLHLADNSALYGQVCPQNPKGKHHILNRKSQKPNAIFYVQSV